MDDNCVKTEEKGTSGRKRFKLPNKYLTIGLVAFIVVAACILFYYLFFEDKSLFGFFKVSIQSVRAFIIGAVLAYLLKPICAIFENWLGKAFAKLKNRKRAKNLQINIAIGCTAILFVALVYVLFAAIIPEVIDSVMTISENVPGWLQNISDWLTKLAKNNANMQAQIKDFFTNFSDKVVEFLNEFLINGGKTEVVISGVTNSLKSILVLLKDILVGGVSCIYILHERKKFAVQGKMLVYSIFKGKWADKVMEEIKYTDKMFSGFINGKIIDSIIIGILCFIVTSLCRIPYALLISVFVGITNIIPFFGPFIGAIPSALIVLMISPIKCLYFIIIIVAIQQFDGNILGPKILGNSTGLSSFWVLFSITFFGGIWGFAGMVLGVPVFAVLYDIIRRLVKKGLDKRNRTEMYDEYELDRHIEIQERAEAKAKRVSRLTRFKSYKVHPDDDKNKN